MNNLTSIYCYYCERPYGAQQKGGEILLKTKDHIIPISKGGRLRFKKNILYCCDKCNQLKADLTPSEFADLLKDKFDNCKVKIKGYKDRLRTMLKNTVLLIIKISKYEKELYTVRAKKFKNIPSDKVIETLAMQWQENFERTHRPSTPLWWRGLNDK